MQILGFLAPVRFRGHFEEIGIAKILLNTKPRRVGKFRGFRFSDVWESVAREKNKENKLSAKYNGSLALATLERATIIIMRTFKGARRRHSQLNRNAGKVQGGSIDMMYIGNCVKSEFLNSTWKYR